MRKLLNLCLVILSACAILLLLTLLRPEKNETCARLQARIDLSESFCKELAEKAAEDRCSALAEQPEVLGQCKRVIVPAAFSGCIDYLNKEAMEREFSSVCD